jgi:hypothetical protein
MSNTTKCTDGIYRTATNPEAFRTVDGTNTVGELQGIDYIEERSDEEIEAAFREQKEFEEWLDTRAEENERDGTFDNDDYSEESRP